MADAVPGGPLDDGSGAPNLRAAVAAGLSHAFERAVTDGSLPAPEGPAVETEVSRPANPDHGDFATNVALRLARPLGMAPTAIANAIVGAIESELGPSANLPGAARFRCGIDRFRRPTGRSIVGIRALTEDWAGRAAR